MKMVLVLLAAAISFSFTELARASFTLSGTSNVSCRVINDRNGNFDQISFNSVSNFMKYGESNMVSSYVIGVRVDGEGDDRVIDIEVRRKPVQGRRPETGELVSMNENSFQDANRRNSFTIDCDFDR